MRKWMLAILTLALLLTGVASAEIERHYSLPLGWTQTDDGTSDGLITDPDGKTYDSISETIWGVPRYRLPGGWRYGENATVISPEGKVYENLLHVDCIWDLNMKNWGYMGDLWWGPLPLELLESELLLPGLSPELGDDGTSLTVLISVAGLALAGAIFARGKAKHA